MIHFVFNPDSRDRTTGIYMMDAVRRAGLEFSWTPKGVPQYLTPQVVIKIDDGDLDHYQYNKNNSCPTFWWFIDSNTDMQRGIDIAKNFDVTLCADFKECRTVSEKLGQEVTWMPLACDPTYHNTIYPKLSERPIDVGFSGSVGDCGGWNKGRPELLKKVGGHFKNSVIRETTKGQNVIVNGSCKVILNDNPWNNINMRHFEAISSGSILVCRKIEDNGLEYLGTSDSVLFYETEDEAVDQIKFALKNIDRFEEPSVDLAGHYWKNHTYSNRFNQIIDIIRASVEQLDESKK